MTRPDPVAACRNVPLDRVAIALGYRRDPRDPRRWKRDGSVISINGEKFFDHLNGTGGGGAIDLVIHATACRFPDALRFLPVVLGGAHALSLLVWIGLGLGAMVFAAEGRLGELGHPDEAAFLVLGVAEAPALLLGLVTAALLAAILSTADTFLNLGAAALVRDIPRALGHEGWSGLRAARGAALLVGLVALGIAAAHLGGGELIAWLGTLAFGAFASGLAPVLTLGLLLPEVSARCAGLAMATGLASHLLLEGQGLVVPPALAGMVIGFLILLAGAFIAPEKSVPSRVRLALTL